MLERHSRLSAKVGHVMRRAALAFLALGCAIGCGEKPTLPITESSVPAKAQTLAGANLFQDVTAQSGVTFVHRAGTNYFMPDQVGSGITLLDFDQDSRLDLFLVQNGGTGPEARNRLYHQQPTGVFKDVSEGSGVDIASKVMGAIAGDVNNDGLPEIVLTEYGATKLFLNLGAGQFRNVTSEAGIDNPRWAAPASFMDFDRDGLLDLVVGNYVDYDPTQLCKDQQGRLDFCAPQAFPATVTRLWRNTTRAAKGPPTFEDWTVRSGIVRAPGVALGLVCADFTGDNWPDIFCADDGRPNRLFVNQRNGTFVEEAALRGLSHNAMGRTAANMGVAFADFNGDALADLFVTHLTEEFHSLFRQDQPGLFSDAIAQSGMQQQGWRGTGFGTVAADFNHDGWNDIAFVNGLVRRATPGQTPVMAGLDPWWARYAQRPQIFLNNNGQLRDASESNPGLCKEASVGRSLAMGDLNNDGAIDLIVGNLGGPVRLYHNVAQQRGHWLKLRLVNPAYGSRDAIGAEVSFQVGERRFWNVLQPATSYLVSNDPVLHFGLGTITAVEQVQVVWPEGGKEIFQIGNVDRAVTLKKGQGKPL